ncbi:Cholesterol oxidase [Pseudocercospora fuligena]|uniref:Cholesterol oxidase n=1 Tax=Pseudocercospora fuligena TaxID=685502 RepID=A0A8H6VF53_9PEZI|nr:Cholesterol oxidase [Pseudocercospora fuligena]
MASVAAPSPRIDRDKTSGIPLEPSDYAYAARERDDTSAAPRISRPVTLMRPEYDVVVVGSGYGGGVAASRFARAGKSVAVLELGLEKWPGEYPSGLLEAAPEVHVSGNLGQDEEPVENVSIGRRTGLYHLILGEGQNAFVANGLGGTSLLNANVFLHADERTLSMSEWPPEIRSHKDSLADYYHRAEQMLQPSPYPESYPSLKKLEVLEKQAKSLGFGDNFYRVPQTTFWEEKRNNAGVEMKASTCSGQDCTGVNDGSKNSVLMNYLPDAWNWGAEIFCECEVRHIQADPNGRGYLVFFAWHADGRDSFEGAFHDQLMWVRAKEFCFLGAGALGTTEILLRSQAHGMEVSPLVGQKLSGNGDMLCFGYNTDEIVNAIGKEESDQTSPCGPTITGVIDNRNPKTSPEVLDGYVIEEGAIPQSLGRLLQPILELMPGKWYPTPYNSWRHFVSRMRSRLSGPYAIGGSINRTQTYLVVSHDSNEGIMTLSGNKAYLQFLGVGNTKHVGYLEEVLKKATNAIGGTLINSPFYAAFNQREQITVHPIGGAKMSSDGTGRSGATDHLGQVFKGEGDECHRGLICVDASVIPIALGKENSQPPASTLLTHGPGVNPFATITALAERSCSLLLKEYNLIEDETSNGDLDLHGFPRKIHEMSSSHIQEAKAIKDAASQAGIRFTEIMDGHIYVGSDIDCFVVANKRAKGSSSSASLYVTVDAYSVQNLIERDDHASVATGTFACAALSKDPLMIQHGEIQFFTQDETVSDAENLAYKLDLLSTEGKTYFFYGYKKIDSSMTLSARKTWKATTTLYIVITNEDDSIAGRGIITISWRNFISELGSFGATGETATFTDKLFAPLNFVNFFAQNTAAYFFSPFRGLQRPINDTSGFLNKAAPIRSVMLTARDGVQISMKVWEPQKGKPTHAMALLFIPGASVNETIFSLPTIPINTIDYFTDLGYRCYVVVPRFGISEAEQLGYTAYDARWDIKAAVDFVLQAEDGREPYVVCHCLGSITTGMALLTGAVDARSICGMTSSQVLTNLRFGKVNALKSSTQLLTQIYEASHSSWNCVVRVANVGIQKLAGSWFPCNTTSSSGLVQNLLDQILRLYPVGNPDEVCNSSVCHRGSLVFGRLWQHANLNRATHAHLNKFLGGIHMNFLSHLMRMGAEEPHHPRSSEPEFADLVEDPGNLERLKGLKIQFISGGENVVFSPLSTSESYDLLRDAFGEDGYERVVVDGYGHLDTWMGKASFRDVYPRVQWHIEECERLSRDP